MGISTEIHNLLVLIIKVKFHSAEWKLTSCLLYKKQFDKISGSRKQTVLLPVSAVTS